MPRRRPIELKDRQRVLELANQGLSSRQIAQRLGIALETVRKVLVKGLPQCSRCDRRIPGGGRCPVCTLPAQAPFGDRLKAFRSAASLSQLKLALILGVDYSRIRQWECGQKPPAAMELTMLANALGLTVQELTGITETTQGD